MGKINDIFTGKINKEIFIKCKECKSKYYFILDQSTVYYNNRYFYYYICCPYCDNIVKLYE